MGIIDISSKIEIKEVNIIKVIGHEHCVFIELNFKKTILQTIIFKLFNIQKLFPNPSIMYDSESGEFSFIFSKSNILSTNKTNDLLYGFLLLINFHHNSKKLTTDKFIKIFNDMGIKVDLINYLSKNNEKLVCKHLYSSYKYL